jgi:hypothetical protein
VARGHRLYAERAGVRIGPELANGTGEKLKEFLNSREVGRTPVS